MILSYCSAGEVKIGVSAATTARMTHGAKPHDNTTINRITMDKDKTTSNATAPAISFA